MRLGELRLQLGVEGMEVIAERHMAARLLLHHVHLHGGVGEQGCGELQHAHPVACRAVSPGAHATLKRGQAGAVRLGGSVRGEGGGGMTLDITHMALGVGLEFCGRRWQCGGGGPAGLGAGPLHVSSFQLAFFSVHAGLLADY